MRFFNFFKIAILLLFVVTYVTSCKDPNEEDLSGISILLVKKGLEKVTEGMEKTLEYDVVLSEPLSRGLTLEFGLVNAKENSVSYTDIFEIPMGDDKKPKGLRVIIKAGQTKAVLKVKNKKKVDAEKSLKENAIYQFNLRNYYGVKNSITLKDPLKITVEADKAITPLTSDQKKMFAAWKKAGIDLSKFIGKVNVATKVTVSSDDATHFGAPFTISKVMHTYTGQSIITVSSKATTSKPILIFTKNAMGLNDLLQHTFRKKTIEDTQFSFGTLTTHPNYPHLGPNVKNVKAAIGDARFQKWKNKEYAFNVKLDNVVFELSGSAGIQIKEVYRKNWGSSDEIFYPIDATKNPTNKMDFYEAGKEGYGLNFTYDFQLWDEFWEIVKAQSDKKLYKAINQDYGNLWPGYYNRATNMASDDWGESLYVKPSATYDKTKNEIKFVFPLETGANQSDYYKVEVTYTPIKTM